MKDKEYMKKNLIKGLPDVIERVRQMREGVGGYSCEDAGAAEATSNQEYVKGLSAWNFDVKELRRQVLAYVSRMPLLLPPFSSDTRTLTNQGPAHGSRHADSVRSCTQKSCT
jgi:hypothetical protein